MKFGQDQENVLMPKAKYMPPPCLKAELDYLIRDIDQDLADMFKSELKVDFSERMKDAYVWNQLDIKGSVDTHSIGSEEAEELLRDGNKCGYCLLDHKDCHNNLFGTYCTQKSRYFMLLYPAASTRDAVKAFFLQRYHWALHIHIFLKYEIIANESMFVYPPACLEQAMEDVMDLAERNHNTTLKACEYSNVYEYAESAMNFEGMDKERT